MFGMSRSPTAAYAQVSMDVAVEAADPHRLILMLYDGATAAIASARGALARKEYGPKGEAISKAINIINDGLIASLNVEAGGDIAERLAALYEYMSHRLIWANAKNDDSALEEVSTLLLDLRSAWAEIGKPSQDGAQ